MNLSLYLTKSQELVANALKLELRTGQRLLGLLGSTGRE